MMHFAKVTALFLCSTITLPMLAIINIVSKQIDSSHHQLALSFDVPRGDFIYKDYLFISTDSPDTDLTAWHASVKPVAHYDLASKHTKKVYNKPFIITLTAHTKKPNITDMYLYVTYYQHSRKKITPHLLTLTLENEEQTVSMLDTQLKQKTTINNHNDLNVLWQTYINLLKMYIRTFWTFFMLLFGIGINAAAFFSYPLFILWYSSLYDALFVPLHTVNWVMSIITFSFGLVNLHPTNHKKLKTIIGMCAIALSVLFAAQSYKMRYIYPSTPPFNKLSTGSGRTGPNKH